MVHRWVKKVLRGRHAGRVLAALALSGAGVLAPLPAAAATAACARSPGPLLELAIVSAALRGAAHEQLQVRVYEDGCVAVQRPWYLRNAGHFELHLDAAGLLALRQQVAVETLCALDQRALKAERQQALVDAKSAAGTEAIEFHTPDADHFLLRWREGSVERQLAWSNLLDDADRHPKAAGLNAMATAVRALWPLLNRDGKRVDSGARR